MKNAIFGAVGMLLLIALLAASNGGFNLVWDNELKRPEAQQAIKQYVESHCEAMIWKDQWKLMPDQTVTHLHLDCWVDQPTTK